NSKAPKKGDASAEEVKAAKENFVKQANVTFPIENKAQVVEGKISDYPGEENAFRKLRDVRSEARLAGIREKRAKAKAEEAANAKK
ncbi:hypothetical protein KCU78_g19898, partial [Aureobasidium melanogenum]